MTRLKSRATKGVDRTSERWQRIRRGCQHGADYIDLDVHADQVWLTVETLTQHTNGRTAHSLNGNSAPCGQTGAS